MQHRLARAWYELSRCRLTGRNDYAGAYDAAAAAARLWDALSRKYPDDVDYKKSLARAYNVLGMTSLNADSSFLAYQQSLRIRLDLLPSHPNDVEVLHGLGESFNNLGLQVGDLNHRLLMQQRSIEYNLAAVRLRPLNVEYATDLGIGYLVASGQFASLGRAQEALSALHLGIAHLLRFTQANPAVPAVRELIVSTLTQLRRRTIGTDHAKEFAQIFREVADGYSKLPQTTAEGYVALARVRSDCARQILRAENALPNHQLTTHEQAEIDELRHAAIESLLQAVAAGFKDRERLQQDPLFGEARAQPGWQEVVPQIEAAGKQSMAAKTSGAAAQQLVQLDQDRATSFLAFALVETALNRTREARESFRQALAIRKRFVEAAPNDKQLQAVFQSSQGALAELRSKTGYLAQARTVFRQQIASLEQAASKTPAENSVASQLADAHRALGDVYAQAALWDEVALQYAEYSRCQPDRTWPAYLEILAPLSLLLRGERDAYRAGCRKLWAKYAADPNSEHTSRLVRVCALIPGAIDDLPGLLRIAEKGPHDWLNYAYALALYRAGRFEQAIGAIEQARAKGDLAGILVDTFVLAMSHYQLGRREVARELLAAVNRQAAQAMPKWTRLPYNALDADWVVLRREANELIFGGPYSPDDRFRRARAYVELGDLSKAEAEYATTVKASPESPASRAGHALVLAEMGRKQQAAQCLKECAALAEKERNRIAGDVEFWRSYGDALRLLERFKDAGHAYRRALAAHSLVIMKDPRRHFADSLARDLKADLVDTLQAAGRTKDAQAEFAQLNRLLLVFDLAPVTNTAADLLQPRPAQTELIGAIDQLLASDASFLADDDPVRLERAALLHHRKATLLEREVDKESEIRNELSRAREGYERVLDSGVKDAILATALADLLLDRVATSWTELDPETLNAKSGTTLTRLSDRSILASGINPEQETYTVVAKSPLLTIIAVRLETLPHASFTRGGSGRDPNGSFQLWRFSVARTRSNQPPGQGSIPLILPAVVVSYRRQSDQGTALPLEFPIDTRSHVVGWDVWPEVYRRRVAVFEVNPAAEHTAGETLVVQLGFAGPPRFPMGLGRFRLSVTDNSSAAALARRIAGVRQLSGPWVRLSAAYTLTGDNSRAAAVVAAALQTEVDDVQRYRAIETIVDNPALLNGLIKVRPNDPLLQTAIANQNAEGSASETVDVARKRARARTFASLVKRHAKNPELLRAAGDRCIAAGLTQDGLGHPVALSVDAPGDTLVALRVAALQAWFGQDKELDETYVRALRAGQDARDPFTAERSAKICCLRATADKARQESSLALAKKALELGTDSPYSFYFQMALGMAEYRSAHFAEAEAALTAAAKLAQGNPYVDGTSAFYRAMTLFRLGKVDEATKLAHGAASRMKPLPKDDKNPLADHANHDDVILWLAYKEAESLIKFEGRNAAATSGGAEKRSP